MDQNLLSLPKLTHSHPIQPNEDPTQCNALRLRYKINTLYSSIKKNLDPTKSFIHYALQSPEKTKIQISVTEFQNYSNRKHICNTKREII